MGHRFLSHAQWKQVFQAYDKFIPEKKDWLLDYWLAYLAPRTKYDSWDSYGPLHVYAKYSQQAQHCQETSAGLSSPHQESEGLGLVGGPHVSNGRESLLES